MKKVFLLLMSYFTMITVAHACPAGLEKINDDVRLRQLKGMKNIYVILTRDLVIPAFYDSVIIDDTDIIIYDKRGRLTSDRVVRQGKLREITSVNDTSDDSSLETPEIIITGGNAGDRNLSLRLTIREIREIFATRKKESLFEFCFKRGIEEEISYPGDNTEI